MSEVTAAAILRSALGALERRGWTQGALTDDNGGSVCAVGALYCGAFKETVGTEEPNAWEQSEHVAKLLGRRDSDLEPGWSEACAAVQAQLPPERDHIPFFNDDPHTTVEDVTLVFKRALELVESGEGA